MSTMTSSLWHKIAGNWKQFSGELRRRWGLLTDSDLEEIRGERDILIGKLQERYGYALEDANRKVEEWESSVSL
jgi:uncharacterized protein YjbJ (UPF0337 family)